MASDSTLITLGNLSVFKDNIYTHLPIATTSDTGVVKIGSGINIAADGAISLAVGDGITIENNVIKPVVATTADINALFAT